MRDWVNASYGKYNAEDYDAVFGNREDNEVSTRCIRDLAAGGLVLEFGIGTGRIALPLAAMGVEVHGIDNSEEMVAILRTKPGGARLPVAIGDCCETVIGRRFSVVTILYWTLFLINTQEEQIRCFENAARHLVPGGVFVVEGFHHDRPRFTRGQYIDVRGIEKHCVRLNVSRHDAVQQRIETQRIVLTPQGISLMPNRYRYIWPSEMDLMARIAGFRLRERWADWYGGRFTADSDQFISIFERV